MRNCTEWAGEVKFIEFSTSSLFFLSICNQAKRYSKVNTRGKMNKKSK